MLDSILAHSMLVDRWPKSMAKPLKSGKNLYIIHAHIDNLPPISLQGRTQIRLASIDMGREHFGFTIETRVLFGNQLVLDRDSIIKHRFEPPKTSGISYFYKQFNDFMRNYDALLRDCDFILIEKQLTFNTKTYRDMQHLIAFFQTFPFNKLCYIIEISAKAKTKYLGCPSTVKDIKGWCVGTGHHIMILSNDQVGLRYMQYLVSIGQKLHEIGDIVCQAEAFMKILAIDLKDDRFCILKGILWLGE